MWRLRLHRLHHPSRRPLPPEHPIRPHVDLRERSPMERHGTLSGDLLRVSDDPAAAVPRTLYRQAGGHDAVQYFFILVAGALEAIENRRSWPEEL